MSEVGKHLELWTNPDAERQPEFIEGDSAVEIILGRAAEGLPITQNALNGKPLKLTAEVFQRVDTAGYALELFPAYWPDLFLERADIVLSPGGAKEAETVTDPALLGSDKDYEVARAAMAMWVDPNNLWREVYIGEETDERKQRQLLLEAVTKAI